MKYFCFFKQKTAYEMRISDRSSDVCSSDLPTQPSLTNSRTVNAGFEETWDRLVRNLSSEFFVINNIEKASRIINVSFQTDAPERYVDCGVTHRTRSEERRVGKECVSPCISRLSPYL